MITEDFMCLSDTVIKVLEGLGELYSQKPLLVIINHEHLKESTYTRTEPLGYQVIPQKLARGSNIMEKVPRTTPSTLRALQSQKEYSSNYYTVEKYHWSIEWQCHSMDQWYFSTV